MASPLLRSTVTLTAFFSLHSSLAAQSSSPFEVMETGIAEVHAAMREGRLTCRGLVEAYLGRIHAFDKNGPALNAIVLVNPRVRTEADSLDRLFRESGPVGPLHCVPVIVKDNFETRDLQTTAGSLALEGLIPSQDAFQVRRIREAGALVLAKSNMAEFAFSPYETVSSILPGYTKNPYALDRVTAGSSGGTAAAVAASFGLVGLGTDTGNSIRGPSAHQALVGIRSTMGLTSRAGIAPLSLAADIAGPMARSVADAVAVFQVIAGEDLDDPVTAAARGRVPGDYAANLRADGLRGARLGVLLQAWERRTTDAEIREVFRRAVADLRARGAVVLDSVPLPGLDSLLRASRGCNRFKADIEAWLARHPAAPVHTVEEILRSRRFHPSVEVRLQSAQAVSSPPAGDSGCVARERFAAALRPLVTEAMDRLQLDALIYPTWSNPPRLIGDLTTPHGDNNQLFAPATGFPAVTVPMGWLRAATLPAGLQFLGRAWSEPVLFRLAYAYEQGTRHRRPPPGTPPLTPAVDPRAARMDSIFAAFDRTTSPGCAAGALQHGAWIHARGYGMADLDRGVPITPSSVFYTGSVSKQFTAMSIALLSRDGILGLDEPARKYLPELPEAAAGVTIRHMVHHLSGLREKWDLLELQGGRDGDLVTQDDVLDLVRRQRELNFAPGDDHLYNNTAYDLLATIVHRASGKTIREFAAEGIFGPLGMRQSLYADDRTLPIPDRAAGYSRTTRGVRLNLPNVETVGSGSVYSSLADLARWDESFYTGALGGPDLVAQVTTPGRLNDGTELTYAFGLTVDRWRGLRRVHHSGALAGFRTVIMRFPDQRFSAVVLCNFAQALPQQYAERMAAIYLADRLAPEAARPARGPELAFGDPALASQAAGIYRNARTGTVARLEREGDGLVLVTGPARVRLAAAGPDRAAPAGEPGGEVRFETQSRGAVLAFTVSGVGARAERFVRVDPPEPVAARSVGLAGRYVSPELHAAWMVEVAGDTIALVSPRGERRRMTPVFRDGFTAAGAWIVTVERDPRGRVMGFRLTTGRSRNIRFERQALGR